MGRGRGRPMGREGGGRQAHGEGRGGRPMGRGGGRPMGRGGGGKAHGEGEGG